MITDRFAATLREVAASMGYAVISYPSRVSESRYLIIRSDDRSLLIRVSTHPSPNGFGVQDNEMNVDTSESPVTILKRVARFFNSPKAKIVRETRKLRETLQSKRRSHQKSVLITQIQILSNERLTNHGEAACIDAKIKDLEKQLASLRSKFGTKRKRS